MWRTRWEDGAPTFTRNDEFLYCHTRYETFLRVMGDFQGIFECQYSADVLRDWVRNHVDQVLSLGIPHNWFLQVRPGSTMPELRDQLLDDVICCPERLIVLGKCVIMVEDHYEETELVLCMGGGTRLYIYEPSQEILLLCARHLDELARYGMMYTEAVYRQPQTPFATRVPHDVVAMLLRHGHDADALAACVGEHHGRDVNFHTPGRHAKTLKLLTSFGCLTDCWPFEVAPAARLAECEMYVTLQLRCRWYLLGAVGSYRAGGFFDTSFLIVFDRFCRFYVVIVKSHLDRSPPLQRLAGEIYRLADSLEELFRAGLMKVYVRRRYEHGLRRAARLERNGGCVHMGEAARLHFTMFDSGVDRDYARQFRWLCRGDRFRAEMLNNWDGWDAFTIWQARVVRGDFAERRRPRSLGDGEEEDEGNDGRAMPVVRRRPPPMPRDDDEDNHVVPDNQNLEVIHDALADDEEQGEDDDDSGAEPMEPEENNVVPNVERRGGEDAVAARMAGGHESDDDEWEDLGFDLEEDTVFDLKDVDEWFEQRRLAEKERWHLGQRIVNAYRTEAEVSEAEVEARRINLNTDLSPEWVKSFDFREHFV
ncbi:protein US23 [Human betaherpesvirus 5]|uniref:Protein US23 n=1 Tax=Human cytomegalovirus TaxID=10359 RepID=A0A0G2THN4_HCMV|nr:protein US23 [Human betaherpesvirus 5]